MNDDCIYWDPKLNRHSGNVPAFPAAALPAVAGHPVQSLFFSVDPWAICSVMIYATCIVVLWSTAVFFTIKLVTEGFAPRPLYVCRIEAVHPAPNWFNLASSTSASAATPPGYNISFDEPLPNAHGLLFATLPHVGPICLSLKSPDQSENRDHQTNSFVIDWSSVPLGSQIGPNDLVELDACVYFGNLERARASIEPVDQDYD